MLTVDQMRDRLSTQYGYSPDTIPISLGGSFDPTVHGRNRYEKCLEKVTNPQSICHSYYSLTYQPFTTKSSSNILFFNPDHHHHTTTIKIRPKARCRPAWHGSRRLTR